MATELIESVGWDIGGVNVKGAAMVRRPGGKREVRAATRAFEVWRAPGDLATVLGQVAGDLGMTAAAPLAVTMTAELSDAFRSKREGVLFVLGAVAEAFPDHRVHVLSVDGELIGLEAARRRPLDFAATNWVASALYLAARRRDCVLVDVGSTTTDIIPIRDGRVACTGRSDPERLAAGELVYTGVLRTNPNTLASSAPLRGHPCRLAAESFATMADVYLLLGLLSPAAYTCPTADGREKDARAAAERLARTVCADAEMLSDAEIAGLARFFAERQLRRVSDGLLQVLSRSDDAGGAPLAPAGVGAFIAAEVGRRLGRPVLDPEELWEGGGDVLPAAAAAWLLAERSPEP